MGDNLKRLGTSRESAVRLGRKAAEAERSLGIHGVSVTAGTPIGPASSADRSEIERHFPVRDTPTRADPDHKTVELPKPVDEEISHDRIEALLSRHVLADRGVPVRLGHRLQL
jgi:hypothetical protein